MANVWLAMMLLNSEKELVKWTARKAHEWLQHADIMGTVSTQTDNNVKALE